MGFRFRPSEYGGNEKGQANCLTFAGNMLSTVPVHPWSTESKYPVGLGSLQIASGHLARLHVALEFVAKLLAFDDFAHTSTFDRRDVDERISAAIVRLDEAETLGGVKPFYCACGHDEEPFQSMIDRPRNRCNADGDSDVFERKVRSKHGANRAVTKAQQAKYR
jgi:hypothetical protein